MSDRTAYGDYRCEQIDAQAHAERHHDHDQTDWWQQHCPVCRPTTNGEHA